MLVKCIKLMICQAKYSRNTFELAVVLIEAATCNGGDCRQPLLHKVQALLQGNPIPLGDLPHTWCMIWARAEKF